MSVAFETAPNEEEEITLAQIMEIRNILHETVRAAGLGVRTGYSTTVKCEDPEAIVKEVGAGRREVCIPGSLPEFTTIMHKGEAREIRARDRHLSSLWRVDARGKRLIVFQTDTALQEGNYRTDHNRYIFDIAGDESVRSKCLAQTTVHAVFAELFPEVNLLKNGEGNSSKGILVDTEAYNPLTEYGENIVSQGEAEELKYWIDEYRLDLFEHLDQLAKTGQKRIM